MLLLALMILIESINVKVRNLPPLFRFRKDNLRSEDCDSCMGMEKVDVWAIVLNCFSRRFPVSSLLGLCVCIV